MKRVLVAHSGRGNGCSVFIDRYEHTHQHLYIQPTFNHPHARRTCGDRRLVLEQTARAESFHSPCKAARE